MGAFVMLGSLLSLLYFVGGREVLLWAQAMRWVETTCVVKLASLDSHTDNEGSEYYRLRTSYTYRDEVDVYQGRRFDFSIDAGSSEYGRMAKKVRYLKNNPELPCYYNPSNPDQSVIDRGFHASMFFTLIPFLFLIMFLLWLMQGLRPASRRKRKLRRNRH